MIDGVITQEIVPAETITPYAPYPLYTSGVKDGDQAIYRYAKKVSDSPILILKNAIYDNDGNCIPAGYYSLVLGAEKKFLYLVESSRVIAAFPVFKLEEDKEQIRKEKSEEYLKKRKKKLEQREKINQKLAKNGFSQVEDEMYMDATVKYVEGGQYYLIKYERDKVRAWGAFRTSNFY